MLYCLKKKALIFWVENSAGKQNVMAYSPEHLGAAVDSDIPLLASYNGWHYQVRKVVPLNFSISVRTELTLNFQSLLCMLVIEYLQGLYCATKKDQELSKEIYKEKAKEEVFENNDLTIGCFAHKQMDKNDIKVSRNTVIRNTSEAMKGKGRNMDNLENSEWLAVVPYTLR